MTVFEAILYVDYFVLALCVFDVGSRLIKIIWVGSDEDDFYSLVNSVSVAGLCLVILYVLR